MGLGGKQYVTGATFALISAATYGVSIPLMKLFDPSLSSLTVSALLYLGCGLCMVLARFLPKATNSIVSKGARLARKDLALVIAMIALNAGSAVSLLVGIRLSDAASASLLGNFEVVMTAVFAYVLFKERMGTVMWGAVATITIASIMLSWNPSEAAAPLAPGALLVLLACVLWGLENNVTRALSGNDVVSVTMVKGFGTAIVCGLLALLDRGFTLSFASALPIVLVGFVSYGLSIMLYILAQRLIGAARTGIFYSVAPFVGVAFSLMLFGSNPALLFIPAMLLSLVGVALTIAEEASRDRRDTRHPTGE